jgi:hypothetical protein
MISVVSLYYKAKQRLNKLASNQHQDIQVEDFILVAREAEIKLVKQKYLSQLFSDLDFLIEPAEKHPLKLKEANTTTHRWVADLSEAEDFLFYKDAYILADKESCKQRVVWINPDLVNASNIATLLNNSNYKPSFEYQETFCDQVADQLGVYTDGTFTPTVLYLSYLRYPRKIDLEGYEDFDGNPSKTTDSELPEYLENELLDIIETDIKLYTDNPSYAASLQNGRLNK